MHVGRALDDYSFGVKYFQRAGEAPRIEHRIPDPGARLEFGLHHAGELASKRMGRKTRGFTIVCRDYGSELVDAPVESQAEGLRGGLNRPEEMRQLGGQELLAFHFDLWLRRFRTNIAESPGRAAPHRQAVNDGMPAARPPCEKLIASQRRCG